LPPDLARVVVAWPNLTEAARSRILAVLDEHLNSLAELRDAPGHPAFARA
jgi:hypothetical protein